MGASVSPSQVPCGHPPSHVCEAGRDGQVPHGGTAQSDTRPPLTLRSSGPRRSWFIRPGLHSQERAAGRLGFALVSPASAYPRLPQPDPCRKPQMSTAPRSKPIWVSTPAPQSARVVGRECSLSKNQVPRVGGVRVRPFPGTFWFGRWLGGAPPPAAARRSLSVAERLRGGGEVRVDQADQVLGRDALQSLASREAQRLRVQGLLEDRARKARVAEALAAAS